MLKLVDAWVWDSWYVFDGELHHAFYLKASKSLGDPDRRHRNPTVGHSISNDLVSWEEVIDAIGPSDANSWDSWTTWTGSVVKGDDGLWWMFYTGTSREDSGDIQRVGAATSPDLMTWSKLDSNPLLEASGALYEKRDLELWHDEAFRDPWVFNASGSWHMFMTARANNGAAFDRGVVGHAKSKDLKTWELLRPLSNPAGFGQLEVLQLLQIDGQLILLFSCDTNELSTELKDKYGQGGVFSLVVDSELGPFDISKSVRFPHDSLYAARAVQHCNRWYLLGFIGRQHQEFEGYICDPIRVTTDGNSLIPS